MNGWIITPNINPFEIVGLSSNELGNDNGVGMMGTGRRMLDLWWSLPRQLSIHWKHFRVMIEIPKLLKSQWESIVMQEMMGRRSFPIPTT